MPPRLEQETTEALLSRLTHLARMQMRLASDGAQGGIDQDDLVGSITSTIRVIDCVLLERGAYRDDAAQQRRSAALTAAGISTNPRRWLDDLQIGTDAPAPSGQTAAERGATDRPASTAKP
jgi:hypothetical protein